MNDNKISSNKSFGLVFFIFFLIISIYPILNNNEIRIWSLIIALIFLTLGLLKSKILTPFNKIWTRFGIFLGKIISPVVMAIIFFGTVLPTSILMKIFRKDLLNLKFSNDKTYWIKNRGPKSKMKNQF